MSVISLSVSVHLKGRGSHGGDTNATERRFRATGALPRRFTAARARPDRVECVSCQLFLYQNQTNTKPQRKTQTLKSQRRIFREGA